MTSLSIGSSPEWCTPMPRLSIGRMPVIWWVQMKQYMELILELDTAEIE